MSEHLFQEILAELKELKAGQIDLTKRIENVESNMATKDELAGIKQELGEVKGLVADIPYIRQAVLETNEIVKRIEAKQERHERILEKLALRSIQQEADIQDLRRIK